MTAAEAVSTYIAAKDGNRPWLMRQVFAEDAALAYSIRTDAISFPPAANGVGAITEVLVRQFALDYESIYTFCLTAPPEDLAPSFGCPWLVGMVRRADGALLLGGGQYDWVFAGRDPGRVTALTITIHLFEEMSGEHVPTVMGWLHGLPYPWCAPQRALDAMPQLDNVRPVREYLNRIPAIA